MSLERRHVLHLVYRFSVGGLENMLVQLVNGLAPARFRHTIVALTDVDPSFAARISVPDVEFVALGKPPGQAFRLFPSFLRLLHHSAPHTLHTCNLGALEFQFPGWLARVPRRVHAEHGWDVSDPDGSNARHRMLRRILSPFVHDFVAVSGHIHDYLTERVGLPEGRVHTITNGVDLERFRPREDGDALPEGFPFVPGRHWVIGTIGRLETIKNQILLVRAFASLVKSDWPMADRLRLVIAGEGGLRDTITGELDSAGLLGRAWLAGARDDVPELLRFIDCFVLPSLAEGTSCTLQEAMATALPIVATDVGGNRALLDAGRLGGLVPAGNVGELARVIRAHCENPIPNNPAREFMAQNFDFGQTLSRYAELFS